MVKYETMMILSNKLDEEATKALIEKFKALIEANGKLLSVEEWGKRKLAYEIADESEGYYVLMNFECEPAFPAELDRVYKITDGVLRTLIIACEEEK
ncbi:MAG: 30S ribosomal protein S6 [Oscillospiraceae bacterium]|nr:30S ribosomal protein S6 [Oscillospiraceae bacterium]